VPDHHRIIHYQSHNPHSGASSKQEYPFRN